MHILKHIWNHTGQGVRYAATLIFRELVHLVGVVPLWLYRGPAARPSLWRPISHWKPVLRKQQRDEAMLSWLQFYTRWSHTHTLIQFPIWADIGFFSAVISGALMHDLTHAFFSTHTHILHHPPPYAHSGNSVHFQESCNNEICYWSLWGIGLRSEVRFSDRAALLGNGWD